MNSLTLFYAFQYVHLIPFPGWMCKICLITKKPIRYSEGQNQNTHCWFLHWGRFCPLFRLFGQPIRGLDRGTAVEQPEADGSTFPKFYRTDTQKVRKPVLLYEFIERNHLTDANENDLIYAVRGTGLHAFTTRDYKREMARCTDPMVQSRFAAVTRRQDLFGV
jgi:hypothetical protein